MKENPKIFLIAGSKGGKAFFDLAAMTARKINESNEFAHLLTAEHPEAFKYGDRIYADRVD